jgi:uncharacterized protein
VRMLDGRNDAIGPALAYLSADPRSRALVKTLMVYSLSELGNDLERIGALNPQIGPLMKVLLAERNEAIFANLKSELAGGKAPPSIALLYGAAHMEDLAARITGDLHYRAAGEQWLPAFGVNPRAAGVSDMEISLIRAGLSLTKQIMRPPPETTSPPAAAAAAAAPAPAPNPLAESLQRLMADTNFMGAVQQVVGGAMKQMNKDLEPAAAGSPLDHLALFAPSRAMEGSPKDLGLAYTNVALKTADGVTLGAWWVGHPEARATLILSHGNAGNISHRLEKLRIFHDLRLNVLMYDYRGYGTSEGTPGEEGVYRDARAAYDYAVTTRGIPPGRIVSYGESLGGSVAARLAASNEVGALILDSSFASVQAMASSFSPLLTALVTSKFDTLAAVKQVRAPVLVLHSPQDRTIPYAQGRALFEAAGADKQFVELGGTHNDGFLTSGDTYVKGLDTFLQAHFGASERAGR